MAPVIAQMTSQGEGQLLKHPLKPSVVTHRDQIRLLAHYEIAALLRRNRMILQMWRQSGLGLRQSGQKKVGLSRNSLYWRLAVLEGARLDLGAVDP
jgi:hypothetical protein